MSDSKSNEDLSAAVIDGFNAEWFDNTQANDGAGFLRHPHGDYRFRVKAVEVRAAERAKEPHNMIVVTTETIGVGRDGTEEAIGMSHTERYGTPQSPKYMQQRTANLCKAFELRGPFAPKNLIGREFDGTIVWEKGDPTTNAAGEEKIYVNARLQCERKIGSPPPKVSAKTQSAAAIKHLERELSGDDSAEAVGKAAPAGDTPAWAQGGATTPAVKTVPAPAASTASKWIAEEQVPAGVHPYRAHIALGTEKAGGARKTLEGKNVNPDGPINPEHLTGQIKEAYLALIAKKGGDDLPDLDGVTGAAPAKTGTRTKQSSATA